MRRPSTAVIVAVLAFLSAGCASYLSYAYLKSLDGRQKPGVAIAAAATDIPIGTRLDAGHVKLATWPREALASGYHTDARALSGRVAVRQISAGDLITEAKLMPQSAAAGGGIMTYMVPQGHRAVTVAVNEVAGVAGFITPNSRVDVVLTTPRPGVADKEDHISKIILQNVPVLASGQGTEQKEGKPVVVPTVTLDLAPEDAEKLIVGVGAKRGSLQLLLRNVVDTAPVATSGATIYKVLNGADAPAVKVATRKAPKPAHPIASSPRAEASISVEVIKGGVKTVRNFPVEN